jgi:hypothetical protein
MSYYTPEEIREAGLDDFRVFLRQVWDYLSLPEPTPVQNDMAYQIQHGDRRLIIMAFRGVGKSWITVAFALWVLFMDPQMKILVVSASGQLAEDWVKFAKQLIHGMPLLQHLQPRKGQRDKSTSFDVGPSRPAKSPSLRAAGITGQIAGSRADLIIPDDVEIPKNSFTHHLREKLSEQVKEFDAILKPGGRVVYLGTPQVEDSLYPKLFRGRGYTVRIWPGEVHKNPRIYAGNLAPFAQRMVDEGVAPGTPTDPKRFDRVDLDERRLSYGKGGYALQFMLDTNPSSADKHPLKLKDLIVLSCDSEMGHVKLAWGNSRELTLEALPAGGFEGDRYHSPAWKSDEMSPWAGTVMAIDPSGRGKDETAYAIVRYLHGILYLVDCGGFKNGFAEATLESIAAAAARHGVNYVIDEPNYGGGMFRQLLKPKLAAYKGKAGSFDDDWNLWSTGQKEARILDTLEPIFGSHRLVVDPRVVEKDLEVQRDTPKYSLIQQMTRMERLKGALPHEDKLEAVAMACQYWVEKMNRDSDRELRRHKDQLLDKELRRFMDHVRGVGVRPQGRRIRIR